MSWVTIRVLVFDQHTVPTQPGQPFIGSETSTGDGYGGRYGRNGKFCVTVSPGTRTAGILV